MHISQDCIRLILVSEVTVSTASEFCESVVMQDRHGCQKIHKHIDKTNSDIARAVGVSLATINHVIKSAAQNLRVSFYLSI